MTNTSNNFAYRNDIAPDVYDDIRMELHRQANFDGDFNVFNGGLYSNTNYGSNYDLSGVAWDINQAGTLITPRHIILAAHYTRTWPITFTKKDGTTVTRTITNVSTGNHDLAVALLDSDITDLPIYPMSSINLYTLPENRYYAAMCARNDQCGIGIVRFMFSAGFRYYDTVQVPPIVSGTSGHPLFWKLGTTQILLGHWASPSSWPSYSGLISDIDALIDNVGRNWHSLTLVDPLALL